MSYTKATGRASIPLYLAYRCSNCGEVNATIQVISETGSVTKGGTLHRKSTKERMKEEAIEYARSAMRNRLADVLGESSEKAFRAAELNCKCSKCKKKEPWSKLRFTRTENILGSLSVMAFFISIPALFYGEFTAFFVIAGGAGAVIGSWFLYKKLRTNAMERLISELPAESIPVIALSKAELIEAIGNRFCKEKASEF